MDEAFTCHLINDSGDDDGLIEPHSTLKYSITINEHQYFNTEEQSQSTFVQTKDSTSSLFMYQLSPVTTSTCLVLPHFIPNPIKSSDSFQQLWSPRVYSPKLIDSNTSENTLSILWSLIILLSKLIITGFYVLYSWFRHDTLLFSFCYLLGALFGSNVYFFIDFLLISICIISIFVASYEQWLFHSVNFNEYDNNSESDNQYWRRIKLAAYGLAIGTISTCII